MFFYMNNYLYKKNILLFIFQIFFYCSKKQNKHDYQGTKIKRKQQIMKYNLSSLQQLIYTNKITNQNDYIQRQIYQNMTSLSQSKLNAHYSAYRNYTKKQKKNIMLNKLNIDSGYPQDIFTKNTPHKSNDYIQDNKKNLKNFFKDRLPQDQITKNSFKTIPINFDPLRIFQIKRQQFQLKNQTKMVLNNGYLNRKQKSMSVQNKGIEKISQLFFINDKTLQFKKKFGSLNIQRFDSYSKDNYRRGTRSFMQKRSRILKRQAYEKVFGPDISAVSRTLPLTPNLELQKRHQKSTKNRNNDKIQTKKQDLSNLIKKIQDFKNKIKPVKLNYHQQVELQIIPNQQNIEKNKLIEKCITEGQNKKNEQKVLSLIQNITSIYKGQAIEDNRTKLNSIQDLQQLDSKFYLELNQHKKTRMQKRMYELYKYSTPQSNQLIKSKIDLENLKSNNIHRNRTIRKHPSDILTITDHADNQSFLLENISIKKRMNVHERFRYLGNQLLKAYIQANFYMVKPDSLYHAFWEEKQPFQMEGSYAFFKAIKFNDIQCVKSFINININYLYEIDMNGKTPLIYACQNNKQQIIQYFLYLGSNLDRSDFHKKTALFYALKNQNIEIVTKLFIYGASPWSTNDCRYKDMLNTINKNSFDIAFSNAKKLYLGVRLHAGNNKRKQFWHENKQKINYHKKIQF